MSALGQKPTCAMQKGMSALPPKADIRGALAHVRFGPKADIDKLIRSPHRQLSSNFDDCMTGKSGFSA
jgi:hypothetical protein